MNWIVLDIRQAWQRLRCYDLITQDWYAYSYDTDEVLHARSAPQFLRDAGQHPQFPQVTGGGGH